MFVDSYAQLPAHFFSRLDPAPVSNPRLIAFNEPLAAELGLDAGAIPPEELADLFSGNRLLPGSAPIAMAYAGHQFGHFVPQLGDGRALLLGEVRDRSGTLRDIQLKGSGRTPYSRSGDGRAALGPVLREYLVSEAMHALGIPTTRSLAAVASGDVVFREGRLPGAVLTRVAASHVRVGTFQYFAARGDTAAVKRLADYVIDRHYPAAAAATDCYLELLRAVGAAQAALVARWMHVGFIHGVMNTDNTAISGETIDYGPCAFMDAYDPATVFSSIDHLGRYAYVNQPAAAHWNLARFAETLLPLIDPQADAAAARATAVIGEFPAQYERQWLAGMRCKIGLLEPQEGDAALIKDWLDLLQGSCADFTRTFRGLCAAALGDDGAMADLIPDAPAYRVWAERWRQRLALESAAPAERAAAMRRCNPAVIPRNHRIEAVIAAATARADFAPFHDMARVLARPYDDAGELSPYADSPQPGERVLQTFCGT